MNAPQVVTPVSTRSAPKKHHRSTWDLVQQKKAHKNAAASTSDLDYAKRQDHDEIPLLKTWLQTLDPPKNWVAASYRDDCHNSFRVNRTEYKRWKPPGSVETRFVIAHVHWKGEIIRSADPEHSGSVD